MNEKETLFDKLEDLGKSDIYPFHMPGHKRMPLYSPFDRAYELDITEIEGFDNLHHPQEILKQEMEFAAQLYQTEETFFLVNGSSCGVLAAIMAQTRLADSIILARNSHKSAYHAVYLNRLKSHYVYPMKSANDLPLGPVTENSIKEALLTTHAKVVFITSPTYEGIVSNIRAIADIVHENGGILIVDEAHGAHFRYNEAFPKSAVNQGADIVIQSLHKTMPTFTQTALLHVCSKRVDLAKIRQYLSIFQTSSPSYVFLGSISFCLHEEQFIRKQRMKEYISNLQKYYERAKELKHIKILDEAWALQSYGAQKDISKIVIVVRDLVDEKGCFFGGNELAGVLLETYHLQMEMASISYVIAMTSMMDTKDGFERLLIALQEIDATLFAMPDTLKERRKDECMLQENMLFPAVFCSVYEAMESDKKSVKWEECIGEISAEYLYLYPPGTPVLAPGEKITKEIFDLINDYRSRGFTLQGTKDYTVSTIEVLSSKAKYALCRGLSV